MTARATAIMLRAHTKDGRRRGTHAMLEANCTTQPGIASSSGAAESRSFHDAVSFDDLEVQEQIDVVKSVAPQLHAAGAVLRRAFIPSLHLLESLKVPIRSRRLRIDATTALVAGGRGYSKLLMPRENSGRKRRVPRRRCTKARHRSRQGWYRGERV